MKPCRKCGAADRYKLPTILLISRICQRGLLVSHQVEHGEYDRMEVSLDFLCRKYEGVDLATYMQSIAI